MPKKFEFEKRTTKHLLGLNEDVTFVKGLGANYAIRANVKVAFTQEVLRANDAVQEAVTCAVRISPGSSLLRRCC
ncbi:hypothetical protein, partial [Escherichia coli]|uniref:hypothetical protein n=1 Tax=Escherichia coli TaxID=562 RepID=UPI001BDD0DB2